MSNPDLYLQRMICRLGDDFDLTILEQDIVYYAVLGCSPEEIGKKMGMSTRRTEFYLGRVFKKIGLKNRIELLSHIIQELCKEVAVTNG